MRLDQLIRSLLPREEHFADLFAENTRNLVRAACKLRICDLRFRPDFVEIQRAPRPQPVLDQQPASFVNNPFAQLDAKR